MSERNLMEVHYGQTRSQP